MAQAGAKYKRVLLKVSGEALMGPGEYGLHPATVDRIADEIRTVHALGVQICLVIGGGNIFRGISGAAIGMERAGADTMGMLATVINSLAMQNALEKIGVDTRVQSAIPMTTVCEPYIRRRAARHMLEAIGQMIVGLRDAEEIGGPIAIAKMSGDVAQLGFNQLLWFLAVLSINLGMINLFPIPMLDGGHLLFYAIEAVRGRPLGDRAQEWGFRIGLALVLTLMLFATWNDLTKIIFKEIAS